MLEKVRNSMQSGFTYVLVAGLTVIFMFFFGMPTQTCAGGAGQRNALLASVSGSDIYTNDVNLIYNRVYGTDRTDEKEKYQQRRATSLRSLVLIKLFAERAREAGFRVGEQELKNYIKDPVRNIEFRYRYGQDGTFNGHYYKAYVQNQLRTTLDQYERFKRQELLARKYLAAQAAQIAVPEVELKLSNEVKNTKFNLSFVSINKKKLEDSVEVTDEDVETFLEENSDRIKKYYEEQSDKYTEPAKVRIRRVYIIKPEDSASKQKKQKVKQKWAEAKKRVLEGGESVGTVAEELGESYPGQEKGLMDWSTVDNMDQDIVEAIEGAAIGDVKKVETEHAYMLVKLEDRKEATKTPLEDVQTEIAKTLIKKEGVDTLVEEATKALSGKATETGSLKKALEKLQAESDKKVWADLSVEETGEFTLESQGPPPQLAAQFGGQLPSMGSWSNIPKIGDSKELAVDVWKELSEKKPVAEKVYEVGGNKYIVRLKSRKGPEKDQEMPEDLIAKMSDQKVSEVLGRWSAIFGSWKGRFLPPMNDYGPWIERQLSSAVDEETVTIYGKNSPVAQILHQDFQPAGSAPKAGSPGSVDNKKGKGSPIQIGGSKKGKGKTFKIQDLKKGKKGKTIKIGGDEKGKGKTIKIGGDKKGKKGDKSKTGSDQK